MMFNDLELILDEVPILLVPAINIKSMWSTVDAEGIAVSKTEKFKKPRMYTIINYNCDNIANILLEETLHHYYPTAEDVDVEIFTSMLWKKPEYKKLFQNKIVETLEDYNL